MQTNPPGCYSKMDLKRKIFDYSLKNAPIPQPEQYNKCLIQKTESFITRLRWRTIFHLQNIEESDNSCDSDTTYTNHFGFKSSKTPSIVPELEGFERDLWTLVDSVNFSDKRTNFQKTLQKDASEIRKSKNIIVPADKTSNFYEVTPEKYETMVQNNTTALYKKAEIDMATNINKEAKILATKLEVADRVEVMSETEAFVTIKDHKPNFLTDTKCRLINPAKPQLGKVSSKLLQNINNAVRKATSLKQWRSTKDAITWFDNIDEKSRKEFIQMDIVDFYPSIKKELLEKAIKFARKFCFIEKVTEEVILNSRKTLLFNRGEQWVKKEELFDVSMGAYDGAEVAELVGLLILSNLKEVAPNVDFGLYRDDGLGESEPMTGPTRDRTRKKIVKNMKELGLEITIDFGLRQVDFLDVNFDLSNSVYKPYRKPNDNPCYVHVQSNHPHNTIKQLPKMVNQRLCSLSSNKKAFVEAAPTYQAALEKSGYKHRLRFTPETPKQRQRKRKITWFNPPFNAACTINIGKEFLKLIDRHFPPENKRKDKLEKIISRQTVKISYSGTPNMSNIISSHNKKILKEKRNKEKPKEKECNCKKGVDSCPIGGKCQTSALVYQATITAKDGDTRTYTGCTDRKFKERYYEHTADMRHKEHKKNTRMAAYIWEKKDRNVEIQSVKWEVLKNCHKYTAGGDKCDVCLSEKLAIMKNKDPRSLNKRSEFMNKCLHRWRQKLANNNKL